jgi:hypothetical protein
MNKLQLIILAVAAPSLVALGAPQAAGGSCPSGSSSNTGAQSVQNAITIGAQASSSSAPCGGSDGADGVTVTEARDSDLDAACVRQAISGGLDPFRFCDLPAEAGVPAPAPALTPGLVARAFRRIELPASELQIQPPKGRTLVNFATNFYTEQPAFDRTVTLLGRRVDLRIWPSRFRWVFGDGGELASTSAGAPYPDLVITHDYLQKGGVSPRVDTTYSARFRVDGGAWRDVDGTVTIPGNPVPLEVITARPVLVGGD